MNILLLSRYDKLGASSRYRSYQYLPYLRNLGHRIDVSPLLSNLYLNRTYAGRNIPLFDVLTSYLRRVRHMLNSHSYDLVWIEYEVFPWLPFGVETMLMKSSVPYVVDYDDAVFHRYDQHTMNVVRNILGSKIDHVMKRASLVIAGNEYIAQRAGEAGAKRIEILPTAVDLERFETKKPPINAELKIGWIGTPMTIHYLNEIEEALTIVCRDGNARLVTIGSSFAHPDNVETESREWSEETEIEELSKFDVGIMPLTDSPWERGKCGHKLIQYMACSKPVIASPVGVNATIVEHGTNGFLASTTGDWVNAFTALSTDRILREQMGKAGRKKVERLYCTAVTAPRLAQLLSEASRGVC